MVAWISKRSKIRRVRRGRSEKRKCPECGKTTTFHECTVESKLSVARVVNLWDSERTAFQCGGCDEVMELSDTLEPDLSPRERARKDKEEREAREREARELAAQRERKRAEREAARQAKEDAVDDELAALKKKMGID